MYLNCLCIQIIISICYICPLWYKHVNYVTAHSNFLFDIQIPLGCFKSTRTCKKGYVEKHNLVKTGTWTTNGTYVQILTNIRCNLFLCILHYWMQSLIRKNAHHQIELIFYHGFKMCYIITWCRVWIPFQTCWKI